MTANPPATREFFAFKAARFIGNAAKKVGASLSRLAAGPSAAALQAELESRAVGPPEGLLVAVEEWARLLVANDNTARYEGLEAGSHLTFRGVFLGSRAFELALQSSAALASGSDPQGGDVTVPPWPEFLRTAALPGGDIVAMKLVELQSQARHLPDCRHWAEETTAMLKADAHDEHLRSRRAAAAESAEEVRSRLWRDRGAGGNITARSNPATCEEDWRSSHKAVRFYAAFRNGLAEAVSNLRAQLETRTQRLQVAQEQLHQLYNTAAAREAAAGTRRETALQQREASLAGKREAVAELERSGARLQTDARVRELEVRRQQLQLELEEASQALAARREARLQLLRRRDQAVAEHRRCAGAVEAQLQDLRPSRFHQVVTPRADAFTESEIVAGLYRAAESLRSFASRAQSSSTAAAAQHGSDMSKQREFVAKQARATLSKHARLELGRLEAAGSSVADTVATLLEVARARAEREAIGLPAEGHPHSTPQRQDLKKLRTALLAAREAWEEAAELWGGESIPWQDAEEEAPAVLSALEAARAKISGSLGRLQHADPVLYDIVALSVGKEAEDAADEIITREPSSVTRSHATADQVPHGWEAHAAPDGIHTYYYNIVTQQSQWEQPLQDAAVAAGWRLFQADNGQWFYHNPYDGAGVWWPELPGYAAAPPSLDALRLDASH